MNNDLGYQYDRCISRGVCSINPTTASLLEVIILYLKNIAFYGLKLEEMGVHNIKIYNLVLNTISILSSNYEISAENFWVINSAFQKLMPEIIEEYKQLCEKNQSECIKLESCIISDKNTDINEYIRLGEKEFNKRIKNSSGDVLNLYRILFILAKSISINILTYESYGFELHNETSIILKTLNLLNFPQQDQEKLKDFVQEIAEKNCELITKIRCLQEEIYGKQEEREVSFSTTKGKAVLVVGANLKELELILEKLKDANIDVYTHDNMILAHTFPKFAEYKNLKGQYGQGMENCLLDFSTFPGPIILTHNSLFNVENFYRGLLFTTDFAYSKGVIPIKDNDFSEVIKSSENSNGFKTGKKCESEKIGFTYEKAYTKIDEKLKKDFFKHVIIIGIRGYSKEEDEYFQILSKHISDDILVVSLSCCEEKENILCFNAVYDNYAMLKITQYILNNASQKVNVFFPFCDNQILSIILCAKACGANKIYVGTWNQTVLKPNILEGLKKSFDIFDITQPKKDLSEIVKD